MFDHANIAITGTRVSAGVLAAMLAADGWAPKREPRGRFEARKPVKASASKGRSVRKVVERDMAEALPAGHPVSWAALWGADKVPAFPGLVPMGGRELVGGLH